MRLCDGLNRTGCALTGTTSTADEELGGQAGKYIVVDSARWNFNSCPHPSLLVFRAPNGDYQ